MPDYLKLSYSTNASWHHRFAGRLLSITAIAILIANLYIGDVSLVFASTNIADPLISEMIGQVQPDALSAYTGDLSGEWPVLLKGQPYQILSRATNSNQSISNATQYVSDQMHISGLIVSFEDWSSGSWSGRNVIGELPGDSLSDEIVLLTAHLDNAPWSGIAPGADDNASGCVAVLLAAQILSQYRFARTIRFAFFTGEEQGLLGSRAYTQGLSTARENVVAAINMDMIGWDSLPGSVMRLHTRPIDSIGYLADANLASIFIQTVATYALGDRITPVLDPDGASNSDHASFWWISVPAILVSEDSRNDFNRNYHSVNDRLEALNLPYFTNIVRAVVGTAAQVAGLEGRAGGNDAARLEPPVDQQWGKPGEAVTYSLLVTNTGTMTDSITLIVSDNRWTVDYPTETISLPPESGLEVSVSVTIPSDASGGTPDFASISVISKNTGQLLDTTTLTTVVAREKMYFPAIYR